MLVSPQLCIYRHGPASSWLKDFLGHCSELEGCDPDKIKYIGYHYYTDGKTEDVSKELSDRAAAFYNAFGRKLWLTEMAVGFGRQGRTVQDQWMKKALPALERNDHVFRYTWFSSRNPVNCVPTPTSRSH